MKSYEELVRELEESEESEEELFRRECMINGECRYFPEEKAAECPKRVSSVCNDGFPCSYRGKKTGNKCRYGYDVKNCNMDYHGICGENGGQCSLYL